MAKYAIKRLLLLIPTLLLVCVIVFALIRMIPDSAVDLIVYKMVSSGQTVDREAVIKTLGMDKSAVAQFVSWITGVFHGDLGTSLFQKQPVSTIIANQLPITLELGIITLLISNLISIPLGLFCAARQDSIGDVGIRVISLVLLSLPVFWIGLLVLVYPAVWWHYAPPSNFVSIFVDPIANLKMFILPAFLGAIVQAGTQLRAVRTVTLEVMRQDYIRTAWAKGIKEGRILLRHALRNSMIPIITMIGSSIASLIGGSVIMESLFNIPGIGNQLISALNNRDYPLVQGCVLVFSFIVIIITILVDLTYKWIDPRVELD